MDWLTIVELRANESRLFMGVTVGNAGFSKRKTAHCLFRIPKEVDTRLCNALKGPHICVLWALF